MLKTVNLVGAKHYVSYNSHHIIPVCDVYFYSKTIVRVGGDGGETIYTMY